MPHYQGRFNSTSSEFVEINYPQSNHAQYLNPLLSNKFNESVIEAIKITSNVVFC